jgi:hypothetical protein
VTGADIASTLHRQLKRLMVATVILYLALVALGVVAWRDSAHKRHDLQVVATQTNTALCTLRHDLADRVRASEDFLINHPAGIPGVPAATIRTNLNGQRRTVAALSNLHCAPTN